MSNDFDLLIRFSGIFAGRGDAYFDGKGARWKRPTLNVFSRHLSGQCEGYGIYPVIDSGQCRWGCIDLDGDQYTFSSALEIWSIWNYYGVTSWIERSRSKGWHIWTFANQWIPAYVMRYAGLQVAKIAELPEKTEVNPKNIAPWKTSNGLVNTVRLPYAGRAAPGRQVVLDPHSAMELSWQDFTEQARASRTSLGALTAVASQWQEAARQAAIERRFASLKSQVPSSEWNSHSNQEAMLILTGKRNIGSGERDNQLFTVVKLMHAMNIPYQEALDRISRIWYHQMEDQSTYDLATALKKVERVYA